MCDCTFENPSQNQFLRFDFDFRIFFGDNKKNHFLQYKFCESWIIIITFSSMVLLFHDALRKSASVRLDSCEAIATMPERPMESTIEELKVFIRDCELDTIAVGHVVSFLYGNRSIVQGLFLNKCTGDLGTILTVALTTCEKLESLTIYLNSSRAAAFDRFAHSLGAGLIATCSLQNLEIGIGSYSNYFTMTSDAARSVQQGLIANTSLSTLKVDHCRFAERSTLRIFAQGLESMQSLREVQFSSFFEPNGQPLEDHGVACLFRALENNSQLASLECTSTKCLDEGMIALVGLLDRTPLKNLNLSGQQMDQNEFLNTFHLVGALGRTTTLESLVLRANNLSTDYDMANLAAALTHNTSVKLLDISGNNIRSSAMTILASRIPSFQVLENLLIGGKEVFDDETSKDLARAMRDNRSIKRITCNPFLPDYKTIQYYADLNLGGRKFIEQQQSEERTAPIPLPLWPRILSRAWWRLCQDDQDHERYANLVYYYLQKGSIIFPV